MGGTSWLNNEVSINGKWRGDSGEWRIVNGECLMKYTGGGPDRSAIPLLRALTTLPQYLVVFFYKSFFTAVSKSASAMYPVCVLAMFPFRSIKTVNGIASGRWYACARSLSPTTTG